ncbi:hypothetical protein KC660_01885 [Candidatus Dojkabacteria bacterium]|uniref:Uncharacterized protein n=1 Tax=Candidatus Dojkabacteria bacterium TaxID=2099670 RepID=A0A955RI22_9BACT|nr:hypothetical protein [Candidatus Dojkabacteria bacterium]
MAEGNGIGTVWIEMLGYVPLIDGIPACYVQIASSTLEKKGQPLESPTRAVNPYAPNGFNQDVHDRRQADRRNTAI